jgi:hypothetical protein
MAQNGLKRSKSKPAGILALSQLAKGFRLNFVVDGETAILFFNTAGFNHSS